MKLLPAFRPALALTCVALLCGCATAANRRELYNTSKANGPWHDYERTRLAQAETGATSLPPISPSAATPQPKPTAPTTSTSSPVPNVGGDQSGSLTPVAALAPPPPVATAPAPAPVPGVPTDATASPAPAAAATPAAVVPDLPAAGTPAPVVAPPQ